MSCTLCVITLGGGLLLARKLGISDMVFAIWLSGLNTALAFWLSPIIKHKIFGNRFLLASVFYLLAYLYFNRTGQMTRDVFVGLTVGMEVLFVAYFIDRKWRLIPFQKVILPLFFLILATLLAATH